MSLRYKQIVLGITGGIAAYKAAYLTRLLKGAGADVRVVMTDAAQSFVTPLTFQALSGNPVRSELLDPAHEAAMGHIELARWADFILIAPASANSIEKLANGKATDLLSTVCLAAKAPLAVAPAMNQQMWSHASTQHNIQTLLDNGITVYGPNEGEQACGDTGPGRMLEPDQLLEHCQQFFNTGLLANKRVLITAGPTREPLDPVRYLSNRSSGKMGYAIAQAAAEAGAEVTLITGPVHLDAPRGLQTIRVDTAEQMLSAVMESIRSQDVMIATAAVSDFRPEQISSDKLKKQGKSITLTLRQNPDIVASVAALKNGPFTVGFAAETQHLERYAKSKLKDKNLDMIAANLVGDGLAFDQDDNALEVYWHTGSSSLNKMSKHKLAHALITLIAQQLETHASN